MFSPSRHRVAAATARSREKALCGLRVFGFAGARHDRQGKISAERSGEFLCSSGILSLCKRTKSGLRDSPRRVATFVVELRAQCHGLADMPLGFPLVPRYEQRGVRHRAHGNYQIFYRSIGDPIEWIDILYIIHGAQHYAGILF